MTLNAKPTPIHGTPSLTLDTIRSVDGLFCLNDLHIASGGNAKKQPAFFLRNKQTKALIEELSSANLQSLKTVVGKGKMQGTYACRELVIAYAAWINAAFHLKVIRVFLENPALPTKAVALPAMDERHQRRIDYLQRRVIALQTKVIKAQRMALEAHARVGRNVISQGQLF